MQSAQVGYVRGGKGTSIDEALLKLNIFFNISNMYILTSLAMIMVDGILWEGREVGKRVNSVTPQSIAFWLVKRGETIDQLTPRVATRCFL